MSIRGNSSEASIDGEVSAEARTRRHAATALSDASVKAIKGELLLSALSEARASWSEFVVSDADFAAYVAERRAQGARRWADLYLACACARGEAAAIAAFEAAYFIEAETVAARVRIAGVHVEDLKQLLREKLFVGKEGEAPKIASYGGAGDLRAWFRVVATRLMLNLGRKTQERAEDPRLSSYPDAADNPELAYLKRVYRREFGEAFAASIERLSTRERNLLRYITTEGLSVDSVAALYGVHKATVNRWLAEARRTLLSCVRDHLCRRLSIGATELDSILVMIGSHFDVALPDVPHMRDGAE